MPSALALVAAALTLGLVLLWLRQRSLQAENAALSHDIARLAAQSSRLVSDNLAANEALEKLAAIVRERGDREDARFNEVATNLEGVGRLIDSKNKDAILEARRAALAGEERFGGLQTDLTKLDKQLFEIRTAIESGEIDRRVQDLLQAHLDTLANAAAATATATDEEPGSRAPEERIESLAADVKGLEEKLTEDVERERSRLYSYLLNLSTINSSGFLSHRRHLAEAAIRDLLAGYVPALGLEINRRQLAYMAHKVCLLEDKCIGRLATSIETIIVRLLAARHLVATQKKLHIVEIGTLFGVGAAALYQANRLLTDDLTLTLIDPLTGYYGAGQPDLITGEPVTMEALQANLARCDVAPKDVRILKGLSQDIAIREACADDSSNLLIIDGDHTREGVKRDFENYRRCVSAGGLIVFDDYDVREWPDIKAYVDEEIAGRGDLELIGKGWRTALFRALPGPG